MLSEAEKDKLFIDIIDFMRTHTILSIHQILYRFNIPLSEMDSVREVLAKIWTTAEVEL